MQEFLNFVLTSVVIYFAARFVINVAIAYFKIRDEALATTVNAIVKDTFIFVKPEKHGDMIYLFETETDNFVAQGKDKEELLIACKARYPTKNVVMTDEDAIGLNL